VIPPIDPTNRRAMVWTGRLIFAFIAGFLSVIAFHQPILALLHEVGLTPLTAYSMQPTEPFGIRRVISLALWGGLWAVPLAILLAQLWSHATYWVAALLLGALAPSLVNWLFVLPLKGVPIGVGWNDPAVLTALVVNAAWGLGTALLWRLAIGWSWPPARRQPRGVTRETPRPDQRAQARH
jgi:hypothetical protein